MASIFKSFSLVPGGLRRKLMASFALMAIIPLLVSVYFITAYIFTYRETIWDVSLITFITVIVALLGFELMREIISSVITLAIDAKVIAEGDLERKIEVKREDEIGSLESSLNLMTNRLRENMSEIQSYGDKIRSINIDINKKVMVLSGLLQIGNTMSTTPQLDMVIPLIVNWLAQVINADKVFLMMVDRKTGELVAKFASNVDSKDMERLRTRLGDGFIGRVASKNERVIIDSSRRPTKATEDFTKQFNMKNASLIPISSRGKIVGLVGVGNNLPDFSYQEDDLEVLNIFARQIAIAIENDWLLKRTQELAIQDELTGLYNESYMRERLSEEIKRAIMYQRPCAFVMLNIDDFKKFQKDNTELAGEAVLKKVAEILKENVEEIDKVARTIDDNFAIVLPEKNKGEAKEIAKKIRKRIEKFHFPGERTQPSGRLTISGGVSANPIDGITSEDLINKAIVRLIKAKKEGKNRIVA